MEILRLFLLPFALIYEVITRIRNKLFDWKLVRSTAYNVPIISVGNLSSGGTGKTPHVEYIIRLLSNENKVATLSRGYGRLTKGFRIADDNDRASSIGDEPMQFYNKFKNVSVVVDADRNNGISNILHQKPDTDVILLDDAFQHRYVKPGLSILLSDYHKLFSGDYLLPYGTLREARSGSKRADLIVITKTPGVLSPFDKKRIVESINPRPNQKLLYSYIKYGAIKSLWYPEAVIEPDVKFSVIMLVAGIANPYPLEFELKNKCNDLITLRYEDHHKYTPEDFERIKQNFTDIYSRNKLLITTEKDAMRMLDPKVKALASKLPFYYIPIDIDFHNGDKEPFDEIIINYVRENKRKR